MSAAIVGGALIAGAATYAAANSAAGATQNAANTAAGVQEQALAQQERLAQPYTQLGQSAIPQLQSLLGLNGQDPTAALRATPGYQFALNQGLDATKNAAAASGMLNSGNTLQALDTFGTGLADRTYQEAVGNAQNVVGLGQAAAAGQAANIGQAAGNLSNIAVNQGNNLANIDVNAAAGLSRIIGGASNNLVTNNTLAGLENPNTGGFTLQDMQTLNSGGGTSPTLNFGGDYTYNNPAFSSPLPVQ